MTGRLRHPLTAVLLSVLLTAPWMGLWATGNAHALSTLQTIAITGISVLGASFLLAWGAETAEEDVPRAFALAILAVLAVAPEYAVDALYAWNAGAFAGTPRGAENASLAVANMTGANRILIGLGWSAIAVFAIYKAKSTNDPAVENRSGFLADRVRLDPDISTEILFLFIATIYAFFVPLGEGIGWPDMLFLVGLYFTYILFTLNAPHTDEEQVGVPAYFQSFRTNIRVPIYLGMFVFSGLVIFTAVEPFAHGLEDYGEQIGVPSFLMIQWVAPLASESPELIVVAYLVNKARSTAAFNALISSKLNQWTLLIGTLVLVYSISLGSLETLPLGQKQAGEIWLTAAQSFFALAILVNFTISIREALALLVLFLVQLYPDFHHYDALIAFSAVYVVLGLALLATRREALQFLIGRVYRRISGNEPTRAEQV
ncbi:sodium:calcium antiporter [Haladaptatus pallidirubidus]|uniref:Sodium:calcium antiporter n=1 Tax=Haladaptatus pallidirubidus TaxID=1008152 RepID=A0AAV3UKM4_9EURY|nr:sodium:calcium antiporter [Haladaptatus pallidirubidus]